MNDVLITLQTIGFLMCVLLLAGFAAAIGPARRLDRRDMHLLHKPGTCIECDADE